MGEGGKVYPMARSVVVPVVGIPALREWFVKTTGFRPSPGGYRPPRRLVPDAALPPASMQACPLAAYRTSCP